jgi:hypothetical protein
MTQDDRTAAQLADAGILAYRRRDYTGAAQLLQAALDQEPKLWLAKLYLAMSLYSSGDLLLASGQFRALTQHCTDREILQKAQSALSVLNSEVKTASPGKVGISDKSGSLKKPGIEKRAKPIDDHGANDLEWLPTQIREHP